MFRLAEQLMGSALSSDSLSDGSDARAAEDIYDVAESDISKLCRSLSAEDGQKTG